MENSIKQLRPYTCGGRKRYRLIINNLLAAFISVSFLFISCDKKSASSSTEESDTADSIPTQSLLLQEDEGDADKAIRRLLGDYDKQKGDERVTTANKIFTLLYKEEFLDDKIRVTAQTPPDSLNLLVWYQAGVYFWEVYDFDEGIRCVTKALPFAYKVDDLLLRADCEHLMGQFLFRKADYVQAIEHVHKSLEIYRETDDKSNISSSLNSLAAICLTMKQLADGERYILEAIHYSKEANDSNRFAIQCGMASEIYHGMGKDEHALDYARQAYYMDSIKGNNAKLGIRLSQMAVAQIALKQDAEGERSLRRAIPILEKAGNTQSLAICNNQMGDLLNRRHAHAEAAQCFEKAVSVFASRGDIYNESHARIGLYEALKKSDLESATKHLYRYTQLKDSIYQRDMEQAVSHYNAQYKNEEYAREIENNKAERKLILIAGSSVALVLGIFILLLLYTSRLRRRNHLALKQMSELREHFFTNITHEFRTPLTVILGLSHDLQAVEAEGVKDKAQTIERQGNGLLTLINQLLDISKVKSAVGNQDWCNGNITAYFTMIVESWRDYARGRNIDLQLVVKETVEMDFVPNYVNKVINNLLSNAFKFTPEYGKVSVLVGSNNRRLLVEVQDTGEGMDKETLKHIFEPFYQADSDARNLGTGIGLALVKQIIEAVEGSITVESEVGKGTTFHISLPIHNRYQRQVTAFEETYKPLPTEIVEMPVDSEKDDNECRLLIVEDNRDIAAYIGSQFTDQYAIFYASGGEEGLEKTLDLVPDLIITDLMMPGMDGLEMCRQIRGNEIVNHIPIIVVTAKITEEERIKGIEAGADAYLAKPFNSDELRTRVEKLLDRHRRLRRKFGESPNTNKETGKEEQLTEAERRFLVKTVDFIYLLMDKRKLEVNTLAEKLCMSPRQLHRKIIALTGDTPASYMLKIKMQRARLLLEGKSELKIEDIADRCGFDHPSSFYHAFKKMYGVTPAEHRRMKKL